MAQNTNAAALVRLKPVSNTNLGSIVEEHVRYWEKNKDQKEARERKSRAAQQELNRTINNATFENYDGLQPEDTAGFLNSQIIDRFNDNKEYYMNLAKEAAKGSMEAKLKLADEKRKINSVVNANKVFSEKISALEKQKSEGNFNPLLDSGTDRFKNSILKGKYKLNEDWSIDFYSPQLEESFKGNSNGLFKDGIVRLSSSQLFNNDFLNSTYSKKPEFLSNGQNIAKNLLDTKNGSKKITDSTKSEGVKLIKGVFAQDNIEAQSFYVDAQQRGLTSFSKPLSELDEVEKNILAEKYYQEFVEPNLQEVDNSLANQARSLDNRRKRQLINKTDKELSEETTTITQSTDEEGNDVIISSIQSQEGPLAIEKSKVFNLAGQPITIGVKGKSGSNKTFSSLAKSEDGKVFAIGQEVIKKQVPVTNDDGSIKIDSNGNDVTRTEESTKEIIEKDAKVLNNLARLIENNDGKKLKNLNELSNFLDSKSNKSNSAQPQYKGLDQDGNPIFE